LVTRRGRSLCWLRSPSDEGHPIKPTTKTRASSKTHVQAKRSADRNLAKYQAEEAAIMRAAYRLIGRDDTRPCTVQDILDEAGLSTRAFYRHFATKDDLIIAMYRVDAQRAIAEMTASIASAPTPTHAVESWIGHWLELAYDPRRTRRVRVLSSAEARSAVGFREVDSDHNRASTAILTQLLSTGLHAGDFPTAEPEGDARAFQAVAASMLLARLFREPSPSLSEARAHLNSFFSRTLGCDLG
jgi:AcrR family transcriptional regulator